MPIVYLVSSGTGDRVPGYELADPGCPEIPGLLGRPAVTEWLDALGYGPDNPDELVYLVAEDEAEDIPDEFDSLAVEL